MERPTGSVAWGRRVTFQEGVDYGLPQPLLEEIFQRVIVPDYLLRSDPGPQRRPEVVLLGGQPGSGKSTTASQFQREFADRGGLVWVTWDDFRPFHPDYERLLAERPCLGWGSSSDMPGRQRSPARGGGPPRRPMMPTTSAPSRFCAVPRHRLPSRGSAC